MPSRDVVPSDEDFMSQEDRRTNAIGTLENISSNEAKKHFFLTPSDLRLTPHESSYGGFGCGPPTKWYSYQDCRNVAIRKHSLETLRKKWSARKKRELKQQEKINKAKQAEEELAKKPVAAAVDSKEVQKLRKSLLKMAKKKMHFEMSGAPGSWRIEVPMVQQSTYAILIGKPNDPELRSLVKGGAYYSESVNASELFDSDDVSKFFSREGVGQRICDHVIVKYKPSASEMSISGDAEIEGW